MQHAPKIHTTSRSGKVQCQFVEVLPMGIARAPDDRYDEDRSDLCCGLVCASFPLKNGIGRGRLPSEPTLEQDQFHVQW